MASEAPITIRPAEKGDVDHIVEFVVRLKQVNEELDPMYTTRGDLRAVARDYVEKSLEEPNTVLLVAVHDGRVIGMIRARIHDRLFYEPRSELLVTDIYVHPSYRRRGVAKQLLDALEKEAMKRGIGLIAAEYPPGNKIAERFFAKMRFKPLLVRVYKLVE